MSNPDCEGKVDWWYLRRRFFSGRSIAWVVMVLMVALVIHYCFPDPAADKVEPVTRDNDVVAPVDASSFPVELPSISAVKSEGQEE